MIAIVCLDDRKGMLFNRRRQSKDRAVVEKLLEMTKGSRLWIHPFSEKLFVENRAEHIVSDECFLEKAGRGEYCFVENCGLAEAGGAPGENHCILVEPELSVGSPAGSLPGGMEKDRDRGICRILP